MNLKQPVFMVNGAPQESVSILDRGLQYGDGVFETIVIKDGQPCYWRRHWTRLLAGCTKLGIKPPKEMEVFGDCTKLCIGISDAVIKIIVTRGEGGRGYRPPESPATNCIIGLHSLPDNQVANHNAILNEGILLFLCETALSQNPLLAGIKHLNRLEQVLGSKEFDHDEHAEGLMLDTSGSVIEGTRSNVFVVKNSELLTPSLDHCGVDGVMRSIVIELADQLTIPCRIEDMGLEQIITADELFITNSVIGIWPVRGFQSVSYPVGPVTKGLVKALNNAPKEN